MTAFVLAGFAVLVALVILAGGPRAGTGGVKPGAGGRVYRNTGTYGSPTWTAQNFVKDCTPAMPWDMAEAGARETRAKLYGKTRADLGAQITMRADNLDAGYLAFIDAAFSPTTTLDLLILDGLISAEAVRGFRFHALVNLTGQPQEIDTNIYDSFDLKPGYSTEGFPSTVVMGAASAPTFTAL